MTDPLDDRARLLAAAADVAAVSEATAFAERLLDDGPIVRIGLSSNVTVDLLAMFLRKHAVLDGQRAEVRIGAFDDHIGGVRRLVGDGLDVLLILDAFDALEPALEARVATMSDEAIDTRIDAYRSELGLTLSAAAAVPRVFIGRLHPIVLPSGTPSGPVTEVVARFNDMIDVEAARFPNVGVIDTAAICARVGSRDAHDLRSYRRFRAPFAPVFHDEVARHLSRRTRGFGAYYYKALVLDADGTLWGGTIGEDLVSGIRVGPNGNPDSIYWDVQHRLAALRQRGVLLALASKNEVRDIDDAFAGHPAMVLHDEDFASKRVDWADKVTSLRRIAETLGIGLDAMVFLDDSPFEVEAVRAQLPMVRSFVVPKDLANYPALIDEIGELFPTDEVTAESTAKTEQYRIRALGQAELERHETQESYLASLGIRLTLTRNGERQSARIAELSQKSNQFNLTTARRTEADILNAMRDGAHDVFGMSVEDRFGDAGLTGVVIVRYAGVDASIDVFLLSCRVLGRGIEKAGWPALFDAIRDRGCRTLHAEYLPTAKNGQVRGFWEQVGFTLTDEDAAGRRAYALDLMATSGADSPPYVEVRRAE